MQVFLDSPPFHNVLFLHTNKVTLGKYSKKINTSFSWDMLYNGSFLSFIIRIYYYIAETVYFKGKPRHKILKYLGTAENILKVFNEKKG